eukprot:TRINITY_DN27554_c0_g1_i1.p1 TRINITY_DN27554_c0_g1~~TRINITY_DN27554_c0_g1_i1.p1  ORF type:complete len:206 (-),score=26.54 TRINITY_DN27554_c0_g1_i1:339-956(-)
MATSVIRVEAFQGCLMGAEKQARISGHQSRIALSHKCVTATRICRRRAVRCQASDGEPSIEKPSGGLNFVPPSTAPKGSLEELFSFSGPAPELINGRLAMWGFFCILAPELSDGKTIGELFLSSSVQTVITIIMLSVATLVPQLVSGVPLGDLLETATASGMPQEIKFMNYPVEKWTGRVAMLGFLGMIIVEAVTGASAFNIFKL